MPILDAQVHAYERNHPGRPWIGTLYGPAEVTGNQMVAAMDAVGVDGAILVSPFSMYRYDASYALEVYAAHPARFRLVKPVDPTDPAVVDTIADWASTKGTVGIRVFLRDEASTDPADPGHQPRPRRGGAAIAAGQSGLSRPARSGGTARGAKPEHAAGGRSSRAGAAARAATARGAVRGASDSCWRWRRTTMSRSRSAAPARCRTSHSLTPTSGTRSAAFSTRSALIAACGARTGPGRSEC